MRTELILMMAAVSFWQSKQFSALADENTATPLPQIESGPNNDEYDSESARKIIGSR